MSRMKIDPRVKAAAVRVGSVLERLASGAERGLRYFYAALHRKLSPPVAVYRKKNIITIADAPRIGGRVHVAELNTSTGVVQELSLTGAEVKIGPATIKYGDEATARVAYAQARRVLLPTAWSTWIFRGVAVLVLWLLIRAVLGAMLGTPGNGVDGEVAGAAPALDGISAALAADPSYIPPEPLPQTLPGAEVGGELADRIYRQAMAAGDATAHEAMPPQPAAGVEGLESFGLENGADATGPGCDPALAFKVEP